MEMMIKSNIIIATLLVLLLLFPGQSFSRSGSLHVNKNMGSEIYEIDYRGPETHTYLPPPNRAGGRPRVHHQTTVARRKQINKGKKIVGN